MTAAPSAPTTPLPALMLFYSTLLRTLVTSTCPSNTPLYLRNLMIPYIHWSTPHYRAPSYGRDLRDNVSNIVFPGTAIPLSLFCLTKHTYLLSLLLFLPTLCLLAAFTTDKDDVSTAFSKYLVDDDTWFSLWRMNCNLAAVHSAACEKESGWRGYGMENKFAFLELAIKEKVPVSPYMDCPIVVKHRNIEGGMGIHFYSNAVSGGDWIVQKQIANSAFLKTLLPPNAPLSTFRVLTQSKNSLLSPLPADLKTLKSNITPLTCVFRAGRSGALTDHTCLLFNVDLKTKKITSAGTNDHWYYTMFKVFNPVISTKRVTRHPDNPSLDLAGVEIPMMDEIMEVCTNCHAKMLPDVPFVGFDVVLTDDKEVEGGICLLEVNLSCNFFGGSFEMEEWRQFSEEGLDWCEKKEKEGSLGERGKKGN